MQCTNVCPTIIYDKIQCPIAKYKLKSQALDVYPSLVRKSPFKLSSSRCCNQTNQQWIFS